MLNTAQNERDGMKFSRLVSDSETPLYVGCKAKHKTQGPFNTDFNLRAQDQAQDDCNCIQNYECLFPLEDGPNGFHESKERLGTTKIDIFRIPKTQQCTFSTKLY